jgi:hypothetical protein
MFSYSKTARERVMNVQEVNLGRAMAKDHVGGRPQKKWRRDGLWKRRGVEKSKNRLSHPAWKSRKPRGIPTFPQPRRLREIN